MEMVAAGRVGSSERRHPRHLAAEGHAPVRLHAFSTGLSSDSPSLSLRHTHGQIFRQPQQRSSVCDAGSQLNSELYQ